jgi:glycosyltransferase involved in cell wall biosynthesis
VVAGKADYYCYVGRLSEEKGVDTLLRAARQLPWPLKIVGGGPLLSRLKQTYASFPHIEFRGQLSFDQLRPILQQARFSVIPSIWYENNPYSVIESLCLGVPVLGARIGGLPELIDPGRNGEWFTPGNVEELQTQIDACFRRFSDTYDFGRIAVEAQNKFSSDTFYQKLIPLYGI